MLCSCCSGSHSGDPAAVIRLLLDAGADPHATIMSWAFRGFGALHMACWFGHSLEVAEALLDAGVSVDVEATSWLLQGGTPLMMVSTADFERDDLAELLLTRGANPDASVTSGPLAGFTPLLLACKKGHTAIVARLLDAGAEVNKTTWYGDSAVLAAESQGNAAVVALLRENGAEGLGKARRRRAMRMALASPFLMAAAVCLRSHAGIVRENKRERLITDH